MGRAEGGWGVGVVGECLIDDLKTDSSKPGQCTSLSFIISHNKSTSLNTDPCLRSLHDCQVTNGSHHHHHQSTMTTQTNSPANAQLSVRTRQTAAGKKLERRRTPRNSQNPQVAMFYVCFSCHASLGVTDWELKRASLTKGI